MFLHPLGLFALLAVPAVVALHLFRRRFRRYPVSALFLWVDRDDTLLAGRRRERLRAGPSFWAEVLAAFLLALAFAGPTACGGGDARHLVVVLDASASMGARAAPDESLRDRAAELVAERIGALPARSRVTLITSGRRPAVLAGPAAFAAEARAALGRFRPVAARHDLAPAVALGLQLSGDGAVLVVGDRFEPDALPPGVELVSVGAPLPNVGLVHAARAVEADVDRVLVTVGAWTPGTVTRRLTVRAAGRVVAEERLTLEPGTRRHLSFEVAPGTGTVVVELEPDALRIDDVAYLAPLPTRTLRLASTLSPAAARALGVASGETASTVDRWLTLIPHAVAAARPEDAHLVLGHDADEGGSATWWLTVEGDLGVDAAPLDLVGPFLTERSHPLLDGVTLEGVVWSATAGLPLGGTPLVSAGRELLLTEELGERRRRYRLNLDPYRSTLSRSPDWPILLANLAELRRDELSGPRRANLALGDELIYQHDQPATYRLQPLVVAEGFEAEARELVARDVLVVEDLAAPGVWSLVRGTSELARFGVSFRDARESDLTGLGPGTAAATDELAEVAAATSPLATTLVALALALLLFDWWVLRGLRRRTRGLLEEPAR